MKAIIILIASSIALLADMTLIEENNISGNTVKTMCVDGYKFIMIENKMGGLSIEQVYESRGGDKPPRPITC